MSKPRVFDQSEFDITQRIIESLTNECTRAVLFSVKDEAKDAAHIAGELSLSLYQVYKALSTLEELTLVVVERFTISDEGKKIKKYRSRIGKADIVITGVEPTLSLYPNK